MVVIVSAMVLASQNIVPSAVQDRRCEGAAERRGKLATRGSPPGEGICVFSRSTGPRDRWLRQGSSKRRKGSERANNFPLCPRKMG